MRSLRANSSTILEQEKCFASTSQVNVSKQSQVKPTEERRQSLSQDSADAQGRIDATESELVNLIAHPEDLAPDSSACNLPKLDWPRRPDQCVSARCEGRVALRSTKDPF